MRATRAWLLLLALCGATGCEPEDPCDPGYYADHGVCVRIIAPPKPAADGGAEDAGPGGGFANDDSDFGRPCEVQEDCGGRAPECGAPMLPLCTAVGCLQGQSQCPPDWQCLDISGWERPYPEVLSFCVKFD